jgi:hypothetical protein
MEGMPQPVDINKLKNILGNAKKIMQVTENGNYKSGNIDGSRLVENTDSYLTANQVPSEYVSQSSVSGLDPTRGINYNEQTVMNSRLPENIKKAMLENPIPQVSMGHTFNLSDVSDLIDDKPMPTPTARPKTNRTINENVNHYNNNSDLITINRNELKDMIKDVLIEFLINDYSKNLTENAIKKTINTLIKEGKISPKKPKTTI